MARRPALALVALAVVLAGCGSIAQPTATPGAPGETADGPAATPDGDAPTPGGTPTVTDDPGVPADAETREATVVNVVDGDTVDVRYADGTEDTVRLVGVDTPETRGATSPDEFEGVPDSEAGRACLADAAADATAALSERVDGADVTLVVDPETDERDRYDRLLAYVVRDDANLNYRLVAGGHARVYDTRFSLADPFYAAEADAREAGHGLWQCADPAAREATDGLRVRVAADAPGNDNENLNGEYVVLENAEDDPRDVGGWTVSDEADHTYAFPEDATIPAEGSIRLHTGSGTDDETAYYWGSNGAVWNNGGDTAFVRDETGRLVVQYSY